MASSPLYRNICGSFFIYPFLQSIYAQLALFLTLTALSCLAFCYSFRESTADCVYDALLQATASLLALYLSYRLVAYIAISDPMPTPLEADWHFVAQPELFGLILLFNLPWPIGMAIAYKTALKYTPYPDDLYWKTVGVTCIAFVIIVCAAYGGDRLLISALPEDVLTTIAVAIIVIVIVVGSLSACAYADVRFVERNRSSLIASQNEAMKQFVNSISDYSNEMRVVQHDQRHFLDTLSTLLENGDVNEARALLEQLSERNSSLSSGAYCSNNIVNAILFDASNRCKKAKVPFNVEIRLPKPVLINDSDLVSLMKNAVDNAVEYCEAMPDPREGIKVTLFTKGNYLIFKCTNPVDKKPKIRNNRIHTTKLGEFRTHGIGFESMHIVARKYNGQLTVEANDGVFSLEAILENRKPDTAA